MLGSVFKLNTLPKQTAAAAMSLAERAAGAPAIFSESIQPWRNFLDFWRLNLNGAMSAFASASQKPRRAGKASAVVFRAMADKSARHLAIAIYPAFVSLRRGSLRPIGLACLRLAAGKDLNGKNREAGFHWSLQATFGQPSMIYGTWITDAFEFICHGRI
jgi:hypothetical protein